MSDKPWPPSQIEADRLLFKAFMLRMIVGDGTDPGDTWPEDGELDDLLTTEDVWERCYRPAVHAALTAFRDALHTPT